MPTNHAITPDTPLLASSTAVATAIPGETVILDPVSGRYYGLDGVGARVWELLQTTTTLSTMVGTITSEYDVDVDTCLRDVEHLVIELESKGLVVAGDAAA